MKVTKSTIHVYISHQRGEGDRLKTGVRIGFVLVCVAGLLFSWNVTKAEAISFPDTYLHPLDTNPYQQGLDRIGADPPFEIYGHDWLTSSVETTLKIWTSWNLGLDGKALLGTQVGDVFIYAPTGTIAVALRDHHGDLDPDDLGEGNFKAGDVFEPTALLKSDHYFGPAGVLDQLDYSKYGDNEIVLASEGDFIENLGASAIDHALVGGKYATSITFPAAYNFDMYPGIRFAWTCANDIHQVPEPTAMLLLGTGLITLAGFRRKFRA
jgi:hypothetical protein